MNLLLLILQEGWAYKVNDITYRGYPLYVLKDRGVSKSELKKEVKAGNILEIYSPDEKGTVLKVFCVETKNQVIL